MAIIDFPEHYRQERAVKRQNDEKKTAEEKRKRKHQEEKEQHKRTMSEYLQQEEMQVSGDAEEEEEVEHEATNISKRKYITKDISNVALASIRYGVAPRPTAAITTAAWIDVGLISEGDTSLIVDHNKVVRVH